MEAISAEPQRLCVSAKDCHAVSHQQKKDGTGLHSLLPQQSDFPQSKLYSGVAAQGADRAVYTARVARDDIY